MAVELNLFHTSFVALLLSCSMAGHSKWANIKHRKAGVDARRGKLFTKVSKEIIVAARLGGADQDANPRLRMAVQNARNVSMPADNIKRAIQRGIGEIEGATYEDVTYEGYGVGGVAILVECTTENRNRTVQEVRATFSKYGGNLGETNSVNWNFVRVGEIQITATGTEESLLEMAIDAGALDAEILSEHAAQFEALVYCGPENIANVSSKLATLGVTVSEEHLVYRAINTVRISDEEQTTKLLKLLDTFEDNDDVQQVFHNAELANHE